MSEEDRDELPRSLTASDALAFQKVRLNYETAMRAKECGDIGVARDHLQTAKDELASYRSELGEVATAIDQMDPSSEQVEIVQDDLLKVELEIERELDALDR